MQPLTERQAVVLDLLIQHLLEHHTQMPIRELAARLGIRSTNGVQDHLGALERKGYLQKRGEAGRTGRTGRKILRWPNGAPFSLTAKRGAA